MAGNIAAAKAFLDAGNPLRAKTELETVLREEPHLDIALDVYCLTLRELNDWEKVEEISRARLGRDPNCVAAYANLLLRFQQARRRRDAARLRDDYRAAIKDPEELQMLEQVYAICFGDKPAAWQELSKRAAEIGDYQRSFRFSSNAAMLRSDVGTALQDSEFARRTGDASAATLERISFLSFKLMNYGKCRDFARQALRADPTLSLPRELIVLSWLSLFPPFLVACVAMRIFLLFDKFGTMFYLAMCYTVGPALGMVSLLILSFLAQLVGVSAWLTVGLAVTYGLYLAFGIGTLARLFGGSGKATIKLDNY